MGYVTRKELERRRKISEATRGKKGKPWSPEVRKKISEYWTTERRKELSEQRMGSSNPCYGRVMTEEERKKLSARATGKQYCLGRKASEETKRKISKSNKGRIVSEETRRKIGAANSIALKGIISWNKGVPMSEEAKKKLSASLKGHMLGEKHWRWQKDRTPLLERKRLRSSFEYIDWRKTVFQRDMFICQECGKKGGDLEANHIIPIRLNLEQIFNVSNGITLCLPCHRKTFGKEEQFVEKYSQIVKGMERLACQP